MVTTVLNYSYSSSLPWPYQLELLAVNKTTPHMLIACKIVSSWSRNKSRWIILNDTIISRYNYYSYYYYYSYSHCYHYMILYVFIDPWFLVGDESSDSFPWHSVHSPGLGPRCLARLGLQGLSPAPTRDLQSPVRPHSTGPIIMLVGKMGGSKLTEPKRALIILIILIIFRKCCVKFICFVLVFMMFRLSFWCFYHLSFCECFYAFLHAWRFPFLELWNGKLCYLKWDILSKQQRS